MFEFPSELKKYFDNRGCFYEVPYLCEKPAQVSISVSKKNVLRGLHYQYEPAMGKQINVIKGSILDCIVDLRSESSTYGMHKLMTCSDKKGATNSVYVPPGFAHGFLSLEDDTTILYFQTQLYNKDGEGAINPFDDHLNIDWGISKKDCTLSEKDLNSEGFLDFTKKNFMWRIL